jgi:ABC-type branched-subunit amino acid transport system ATPase component
MEEIILKTENIYASYGKKEILRGVSIEIKNSEIVSLIGPNGAGKSTLLKVIIGFLNPKNGRIIFKNQDITFIPVYRRANSGIGYLKQSGSVFTNLSVLENLKLSISNLRDKEENIEKVYSIFGELKEKENIRAGLLSGGLKQMLSISMILIRNPEIILLDEPSAGLSPSMVKILIERIKEINQKMKTSILLVEQNIRQAVLISNRAYLLKNGEIIKEEKNPISLIEKENFEKIFFKM